MNGAAPLLGGGMDDAFIIILMLINLTVYAWPFVRDLLALVLLWRLGMWMKRAVVRGIL